MHRSIGFLLILLVTVAAAAGLARAPDLLTRMDAFQIREVRLEGARFLTYQEALRTVAVPPGASVWGDLEILEERLRRHPLVLNARVGRRLPDALVLEVEERDPVALVPTPALVPVDAGGRALPVDPAAHRLDLPLIHPRRRALGGGNRLLPAQLRAVARELGRLSAAEPQLTARISEVRWAEGAVALRLTDPSVDLLFHPPLAPVRLRDGLRALSETRDRWPERDPELLDLRFADQVVVSFHSRTFTD